MGEPPKTGHDHNGGRTRAHPVRAHLLTRRSRRLLSLLAAVAVLAGLAAPAQAAMIPAKHASHGAAQTPATQASRSFKFGLYDTQISRFQWDLDGMPSPQLAVNYQAWEQNPAPLIQFAQQAWKHGSEVFAEMQTTGCQCGNVSLAALASGQYDSYLRSFAKALANFGHPIMLTWDHEMNGTWYSWGPQNYSPVTWVAAWRHTYNVMHAIAPNATWVWAPNTEFGAASVLPYWPGAQYVDEWGLDCYLASPGQTFQSQCGSTIAAIHRLTNAPGLLTETGIEGSQGRPQRVTALVQAVKAAGMNGLVWFDKSDSYLWKPGQQAMTRAVS